MHAGVVGLLLLVVISSPAAAQKWELPLANRQGDTMYTDLAGIEQVAPHVYRTRSKYVYAKPVDNGAEALVQKEYDCEQRKRRVVSAVFYDARRTVTWESKEPGPWTAVTRRKGEKQWAAVCGRVEGGLWGNFISRLKSGLQQLRGVFSS
jgi:hypothetical protein